MAAHPECIKCGDYIFAGRVICSKCYDASFVSAARTMLKAINAFIQSIGNDDAHLVRVAIAANKGVYDAFMELDRAATLVEGKGE